MSKSVSLESSKIDPDSLVIDESKPEKDDHLTEMPNKKSVPEKELHRRTSWIHTIKGEEGLPVAKNQYAGRTLGVFTSGGDAQGMNAALRAVVRMGIYLGCKVYLIHEGYQGMVDGEKHIRLASWNTVSGSMGQGGTIIGSARCQAFREKWGRLQAAKNLVKFGINSLVCIGGDGSLTGANLFKQEWSLLLNELLEKKEITEAEAKKYSFLNIVGMVGSIDNDFCGTDMTIGADSALQRIIETVDAITTTALSHQRCFVLEVMGRHCGYLALAAGLASDADWVCIPENPPEKGWEEKLCKRVSFQRAAGHRLNIIIVAEGAIDTEGNSITANYLKKTICEKLSIDTRVTVLGHVQRGGHASAFDRILSTRMGAEAVMALMNSTPESTPVVVSLNGNQINNIPLMQAVEKTQMIGKAMAERNFERAVELRGHSFKRNLKTLLQLSKMNPKPQSTDIQYSYTFAVMNVGAPACGINSAVRSFVRNGIWKGCRILAIQDGFEGLIQGDLKELDWNSVYGWTGLGGSLLGSQRVDAKEVGFKKIAEALTNYNIQGLLIIGGFEAFSSVLQLYEHRATYSEFRIPLICVPATISNNVPGTDFSIGCDTALNEIVTICDKLKQSAIGSKRRVFIVETMGGYCGYLASLAGFASGADQSYIFEEPFGVNDIINDINNLKMKMEGDLKRGILLRNEFCNKHYTTQFLHELLTEEGKGVFSCRSNVLGHMQQGGKPTPFDRNLGLKLASKALDYLIHQIENHKQEHGAVVIGMRKKQIMTTHVKDLKQQTDFEHRLPLHQWWMAVRPLMRILAHHETTYISETIREESETLENCLRNIEDEDKDESGL